MGRNGISDVFCIKRQEPDLALCQAQKIDYADPASFATAGDTPAHLPDTSRTRDDVTNPGIGHQLLLQLRIFAVGQVFLPSRVNNGVSTKWNNFNYTSLT